MASPCEMPAGVRGFISFHFPRQRKISQAPTALISHPKDISLPIPPFLPCYSAGKGGALYPNGSCGGGDSMISVPWGNGRYTWRYDICFADDIRFAYGGNGYYIMLAQQVYHAAYAVYHIA